MAEFDDPLGLASLWETEEANATLDESRELARTVRARTYFGDLIRARASTAPVDVSVMSLAGVIHVARVGLNWVAGEVCSRSGVVVIPFAAIDTVKESRNCECSSPIPQIVEFVSLGAVLRRWERRSTQVTVVTARGGIAGRINGVFRDAVSLRNSEGEVLVALRRLEIVVETIDTGA